MWEAEVCVSSLFVCLCLHDIDIDRDYHPLKSFLISSLHVCFTHVSAFCIHFWVCSVSIPVDACHLMWILFGIAPSGNGCQLGCIDFPLTDWYLSGPFPLKSHFPSVSFRVSSHSIGRGINSSSIPCSLFVQIELGAARISLRIVSFRCPLITMSIFFCTLLVSCPLRSTFILGFPFQAATP